MSDGEAAAAGAPTSGSAADSIRDLLYGDAPLARWASADTVFRSVHDALAAGDATSARAALEAILNTPDLASRDYLQARHELRAMGAVPDDPAQLYGVVVDMPVGDERDTLAVYRDGTCRFLSHSGKVLIWEADDDDIDALVQVVLDIGAIIAAQIGPWPGPRPPLRPGRLRLSLLCAGGLHFGEGSPQALAADPQAGPLVMAAARLLDALVNKAVPDPSGAAEGEP